MPQQNESAQQMCQCPCLSEKEVWVQEQEDMFWKSMFPEEVQGIWLLAEEVIDELDYPGSLIYDETPDEVLMRKLFLDTYERWKNQTGDEESGDNNRNVLIVIMIAEIQRRRLSKQFYSTFACNNE